MSGAGQFRHEIETAGPFSAPGGRLALHGWCATLDHPAPPRLRLACGDTILPAAAGAARADVAAALGLSTPAAAIAFSVTATLPPGIHLARLEASLDSTGWTVLRRFTLAALPDTLRAAIEHPAGPAVEESMRIQGWCAHPHLRLSAVELHYGNRRVPCEYGLPRTDVPRLLPGSPDAARAGFISTRNIPVGLGPLRVCARDESGALHFFATDRRVDIRTDEENPRPLDFSGALARLGPRRAPAPATPPPPASRPRRILFALYGDMTANSALHVAALADAFTARGHECIVAVPQGSDTIRYHRGARFRCVEYSQCGGTAGVFAGGAGPEIVHAWTTAECVRRFALGLRQRTGAQLVVHLEDHEASIFLASVGLTTEQLATLPLAELDRLVGDTHSHPLHRGEFLRQAAGCTLILGQLRTLLPPGQPHCVFWPAAAPEFCARPVPWALREALGWGRDHTVLFYHGNLHPTNRAEVAELYEAVVALNAAGTPTTLLRAGRDFCTLPGDLAARAIPHVVTLGRIGQHRHLASLLALADCFVQPGEPDTFNDFRFPSKLPEFFASGRPVILPRTNLGAHLRHGVDAYVLDRADAAGIAAAVHTLRTEPALAAQLATGAAAFAQARFNWARSADLVEAFYEQLAPAAGA